MLPTDNLERAVEQIVQTLEQMPPELKDQGDPEWTRRIKQRIYDLGKGFGLDGEATGIPTPDYKEWLFNLIWRDDRDHSLILAMESEWNPHKEEIWRDFTKLPVCRAQLRLFVFQQETTQRVASWFDQLIKYVLSCGNTQPEDWYLFAGYTWDEHKFLFKHFQTNPNPQK